MPTRLGHEFQGADASAVHLLVRREAQVAADEAKQRGRDIAETITGVAVSDAFSTKRSRGPETTPMSTRGVEVFYG